MRVLALAALVLPALAAGAESRIECRFADPARVLVAVTFDAATGAGSVIYDAAVYPARITTVDPGYLKMAFEAPGGPGKIAVDRRSGIALLDGAKPERLIGQCKPEARLF